MLEGGTDEEDRRDLVIDDFAGFRGSGAWADLSKLDKTPKGLTAHSDFYRDLISKMIARGYLSADARERQRLFKFGVNAGGAKNESV
jgi:hypothetical protein